MENDNNSSDGAFNVLDPEHPLLEKFQKALKEHLLNQIRLAKEEVFKIETETQRKKVEIEKVGVLAYEMQQKVCSLQRDLEVMAQNIETTSGANEQEKIVLNENRKQLKNVEDKLLQSEKNNRDLQKELEAMTQLNTQLSQSENAIESHIGVSKRIAEKSKIENAKLIIDKKKQDFMLHTLNKEVWHKESEIDLLGIQLKLKEKEIKELEEKVMTGNSKIWSLQTEYRILMHSWNSVVIAIGTRDKALDCLQQELKIKQEKFKSIITEIERVRKLTKAEMLSNESLTYRKKIILTDMKSSNADLEVQLEKKSDLQNSMNKLQAVIDQTEQDLKLMQEEIAQRKSSFDRISKDFDQVSIKKTQLEEKILEKVQHTMAYNKTGQKLRSDMNACRKKRIEVEIFLHEIENKQSLFNAETACQRFKNEELLRLNKELQDQFEKLEQEQKSIMSQKAKFEFSYRKKENMVQDLNHKMEILTEKRSGELLTKEQMKLKELEKMKEEVQKSVRTLQIMWMREQNNLLSISTERQDQIQNIDMLKKQVLILQQKNVRISDEIEDINNRREKIKNTINTLFNRASILCNKVFKKKNRKLDLDRSNNILQSTYETKLKDSELELLQIQSEITDIEEDKVFLSKELMEINREALEWEKTFLMAKDSMLMMKEARGGEITNMKLEIHKMEVIYGQLRKAQEKLLKDMKCCIGRRDNIVFTSKAFETKTTGKKESQADKIRVNLNRKMDNIRNQKKQCENDIKLVKQELDNKNKQIEETSKKIEAHSDNKSFIIKHTKELREELEDSKINREFKFELLVMHQRRAFMYKQIAKKQKPYTMYKNRGDLMTEYNQAKNVNNKLVKITECLLKDFPDKKYFFIKIGNILGLVSICMYV